MTTVATITAAILTLQGHPRAHGAIEVRARLLAAMVVREAARHDVDPLTIAAMIQRESAFDGTRIGAAGERGLLQILPATARLMGYHSGPTGVAQPRINIAIGCAYLRRMLDRCGGDEAAALSAYNGRGCRQSRYAREVLRLRASVQAPEVAAR